MTRNNNRSCRMKRTEVLLNSRCKITRKLFRDELVTNINDCNPPLPYVK